MNIPEPFLTMLISSPAAVGLVVGIIVERKRANGKCPAKETLEATKDKVSLRLTENEGKIEKHTEAVRGLAISVDRLASSIATDLKETRALLGSVVELALKKEKSNG